MHISDKYKDGSIIGWGGPDLAAEQFALIGSQYNFYKFEDTEIAKVKTTWDAPNNKVMLYLVCRKVLGQDTPNYPQEIGDCVSFGAKNGTEYLSCCEILMHGEMEIFRYQFPPYIYGISRVQIGGGRLSGDGSLGSWAAAGVMKYGMLANDEPDVPKYSGSVAKSWGRSGPPEKFIAIGKKHLVKSAMQLNSWAECLKALQNGYPITIASNRGFEMEAGSDGFHDPRGSWAHQMCIIGGTDDYGIILNNWGDCHGQLKDFDDGHDLPKGCLRAKASVIERDMVKNGGEAFAFSQYDGFPAQPLDKKLFNLIG